MLYSASDSGKMHGEIGKKQFDAYFLGNKFQNFLHATNYATLVVNPETKLCKCIHCKRSSNLLE